MTEDELALERDTDAAWVMSTPQGRRFVHRLAFDRLLGGLLSTPRTGDVHGMAVNVGRQDLARDILALAERTDPSLFERMMQEGYGPARRVERSLVPHDGDSEP